MVESPEYKELLKKVEQLEKENKRLKNIESRLIDKEQRLIAFLNASTESMVLSGRNGKILAINKIAAKRLGREIKDLLGARIKDIVPPDIDASRTKIAQKVFETGEPVKYMDERSGMYLDHSLFPVFDEAKNVKAIASFTRDITKFIEAEKTLKADTAWRRVLMDESWDGIVILNENGKVHEINRKFTEMLGYTREEAMNLYVWDWDLGRSAQELKNMIDNVDDTGTYIETKHIKKDGSTYFAEISSNGAIVNGKKFVFSVCRDITKQKKAQKELKQAYNIMNKSPVAIFLWKNEEGLPVEFVSENIEKILEYEAGEFRDGKISLMDLVYPEDLENILKDSRIFVGQDEIHEYRNRPYRIETKTGKIKWIEALTFKKYDNEGNITHYESLIMDVTERITAEEERKKIEDQLRESQKMEIVGTLASGVAHDLNNILSGIVSYPELILLDLPEDSPFKKAVMTIKKSGEKAAVIVQDLLTLARRSVPISEILNLNNIINELKNSPEYHNMRAYHSDISVSFNLDMKLCNLKGSSTHLSKSVMNLLSNAAEAIRDKGKITVSTFNKEIQSPAHVYRKSIKTGSYVVLSVKDTGTGISDKDLARIFEPFYTKKTMGRSGTGLGMPVVWGTVEDHNGFIDIKSDEGKGTEFILYFPVTDEENGIKHQPDINTYQGNGESILVIDDILEQREIAGVILKKLGYSVNSVSSGEEAIEYLKENDADLLLLDMIMQPGIDGLETYKKIIKFRPAQKTVIASGYSESDKVKEIQRLGGGAYIKKPYSILDIGKAVKEELAKNKSRQN